MYQFKKILNSTLIFLTFLTGIFFINISSVHANVLYSQLDDSVELSGNNFSGSENTFTGATGYPTEVRISYNDKGNTAGHFISVSIVDTDAGVSYYGYNPLVSTLCSNTFESQGLNEKQILTFDTAWEWLAYPCNGANLVFNPDHHYYLRSSRNIGGLDTQVYYGSSSNAKDFYGYIENNINFHDSQKKIETFNFPDLAEGSIDETNHIITLHVPFIADVSAIVPEITISDGSSVSPSVGTAQDFNSPVTYTVTAVDGSTQKYEIKVLTDCTIGCISSVLYSQPDNSTEINYDSVAPFPLFTGASGQISKLKFAYNDHGESAGHFIGVQVVDLTASIGYYSSLHGVCGDAYESTGKNSKVVVELDSSMPYKKFPCTGPNLELDPTHTYGVALFRNHGGNDNQKFYAKGTNNEDVYLEIEGQSASIGCTADCFSNVLFLPGLEASRLYAPRSGGSEDQLWETNTKSDAEDLYLNADGTSKNPSIYTRDIIKETNTPLPSGSAGQNIYKSFSETMDQLVADQKIKEWQAFAYDWRQDINDIVNNGTKYQNGTKSLVETLQSLIASSKNGKVTIVAHSNGGLLAKALLKKLQEDKIAGVNNLIDDVDVLILVAVPEIGTAKAVPSVLHGYDQSMAGGWLMDEVHARELARNMNGAYGLLPSKEYINRVSASPVTFVDNVIPSNVSTKLVQSFGSAVNSYAEYKSFLFGGEGRTNPAVDQTNLPISLSQSLFSKAENLHDNIDNFTPPSGMRVIEVAGWGLDTVASFEYYPMACTQSLGCGFTLDERPRFTSDGDGTVIVPSAQYMSLNGAEKYWVDLPEHNKELKNFRRNREHKDILEVDQLNNFISSVINQKVSNYDLVFRNSNPTDTSNRLRLAIHSPVTLDAYDTEGNHTGKICPQGSDFCYAEENIANSSYLEFGEGKYLNLPEAEMSKIKLEGTDIGTFTYESEKVLPNGTSTTSSFVDIPVTTQTQAEVTLNQVGTPQLALDVTGDGVTDFTFTPSPTFDPITYLKIMKATVDSLDIFPTKIKAFDVRIDNVIKAIQNGKIDKAKLKADKFKSALEKKLAKPDPKKPRPKKLSKADAQLLLDMLNKLLDNIS
jgi:hypothetical protein